MKLPGDITTLQELAIYLHECVMLEDKESRPDIASRIVGLLVNDNWDEWYASQKYPEFEELYDLASEVEAWHVYGLRDSDWQRLKHLIHEFSERLKSVKE